MSNTDPQISDDTLTRPILAISMGYLNIRMLEYLPDGRRVVTGSLDGTVGIWNLEEGTLEETFTEHGPARTGIWRLAVTGDGTRVISGDNYSGIKAWDVNPRKCVLGWTHPDRTPLEISISANDQFVAVGGRSICIYSMEGKLLSDPIDVGRDVWSLSISPDCTKIACGTYFDIYAYDLDSGVSTLNLIVTGHEEYVRHLLWFPDGNRLFSSGDSLVMIVIGLNFRAAITVC